METQSLTYLLVLALTTGVVHTAIGPDHYVPFIAMARVGRWSPARLLGITLACGVGHVAGSVVLGILGVALGLAVGGLEAFETARSDIAAWLLLGFGLAYTAWGVRRAVRNRTHTHLHAHANGTVHRHEHTHHGHHAHVHTDDEALTKAESAAPTLTPWILFTIFVFGPCEPLIPQLMYPAAVGRLIDVVLVAATFAVATIATMTALVFAGHYGLSHFNAAPFERYGHAAAGLALTACALAIMFGL